MPTPRPANSRHIALKICLNVIKNGRSLSQALPEGLAQLVQASDRGFTQNLVLGTLRWQIRLAAIRALLLKKPLKEKDEDINQVILLGLYQIMYMDVPAHAAVSETVALTQKLKKPWAKALVNGLLRTFLREQDALCAAVDVKPAHQFAHPQWLTKALRQAYPKHWQAILTANNQPAGMTLRTNPLVQTRDTLLALLHEQGVGATAHPHSAQGIQLTQSLDVSQLPTFEAGGFSVQDGAAQQAGYLLAPKPGENLLDACAAPGGKTCHLLELSQNKAQVFALEKQADRMDRLQQNLARLNLQAQCQVGDAAQPNDWWNGQHFDKILLDAPCSATGIIRRHPDIKHHRTQADIDALTQLQADILNALWPLLKPGGQLLYATCSILPAENGQQIQRFLTATPDAQLCPLDVAWGIPNSELPGRQILPGMDDMDGFYYCLISKQPHQ